MKLFKKSICIFIWILTLTSGVAAQINSPTATAVQQIISVPTTVIPPKEPPDWRDFRTVSAHPDGEQIVFVECDRDIPANCRVLRMNLKKNELFYYALPPEYTYSEAYFSPSGNKIAMIRVSTQFTTLPDNLEHREIVVMNSDGSGYEVIPLALGAKTRPTFNTAEDHLAFWRAKPREAGAKSIASGYDVWEYDFKTQKEKIFSVSYRFFEGGEIHYLPNESEMLVSAFVPLEDSASFELSTSEYISKYPTQIFKLKRDEKKWNTSMVNNPFFYSSTAAQFSIMKNNDMILKASTLKGYMSIYKQEKNGAFFEWSARQLWNEFDIATMMYSAMSGDKLIGIFNDKNQQQKSTSKRFLMLDMIRNEWSALIIPVIKTATPIGVSLKWSKMN